ncbi:hypothetical protein D9M69_360840 [compost metagenome]
MLHEFVEEGLDQISMHVPSGNLGVIHLDLGRTRRSCHNVLRVQEIMAVVRPCLGVRHDGRDRSTATACTTGTLLVIFALGGNVSQRYRY